HKPRLDALLPTTMRPWRHNDLRRTARTLMSRAKVEREHAERTLGHTIGGIVEGTYDHHVYLDEKSEALFQLAALLDEILHSGPAPVLNIMARKPRIITPKWQTIVNMIAATKDVGANVDQVMGFCEKAGIVKKRTSIYQKLFQYTKRG